LYYAARGPVCKLCVYCKNYTIIWTVRCTNYCCFFACGPRRSPQCGRLPYKVWRSML
jgi:hypothetical protein